MINGSERRTKAYRIEKALDRLKGKGKFTLWDFMDTVELDLTRMEAAGALRKNSRVKYYPSPPNLRDPGLWEVIE